MISKLPIPPLEMSPKRSQLTRSEVCNKAAETESDHEPLGNDDFEYPQRKAEVSVARLVPSRLSLYG